MTAPLDPMEPVYVIMGPEDPQERRALIESVAAQMHELIRLPDSIPKEIGGPEEPETGPLIEGLAAWARLLDAPYVQNGYVETPFSDEEKHWLTTRTLRELQAICSRIRESLLNLTRIEDLPKEHDKLMRLLRSAVRRSTVLNTGGIRGMSETSTYIIEAKQALEAYQHYRAERRDQEANDLLDALKDKATEGAETLDALKRASGATGDERMSSYYQGLADGERTTANHFRAATIVFVALGGAVGLAFLLVPLDFPFPLATDAERYIRLVQKVVAVGGLFGIAGYMARQAQQHRALANWANSLTVQLQTFDAYLAAVDDADLRGELRKSFAARVFGDHPVTKGEQQSDASTLEAAANLLAKFLPASKQ